MDAIKPLALTKVEKDILKWGEIPAHALNPPLGAKVTGISEIYASKPLIDPVIMIG